MLCQPFDCSVPSTCLHESSTTRHRLLLQVLMSSHALEALCRTLQLPPRLTNLPPAASEAGEQRRQRQQLRSVSISPLPLLQLWFTSSPCVMFMCQASVRHYGCQRGADLAHVMAPVAAPCALSLVRCLSPVGQWCMSKGKSLNLFAPAGAVERLRPSSAGAGGGGGGGGAGAQQPAARC